MEHIFTAVCLCVCLSVLFQPNGCTDLDAVFAKRLYATLAQTLLKLVTLGQRSRSQWLKILFFFTILYYLSFCISQISYVWSIWNLVCRFDMPFADLYKNFMKIKWGITSWRRHLRLLHTIVQLKAGYFSTRHAKVHTFRQKSYWQYIIWTNRNLL